MTVTATYPIAPAITPLRGTLLDAASVSDGIEWLDGQDLFDSYNCMTFQAEAEFCAPNAKTFDNGIGWQSGFRFAAYGGAVCRAVGLDQARMLSEVSRVFEAGESTAVEQALMATRFQANADIAYLAPPVMAAGSTATVGGTLAAGTYSAVITVTTAEGESVASNEIAVVTTGATSTITFDWSAVVGETGHRLYVTAVDGASGSETHLIDLAADVITYVWTGTPAPGAAVPPTVNSAALPDVLPGNWDIPTDITPAAGAVSPAVGLALLEGHAASNYVGVPTLHLPRVIASLLTSADALEFSGDMLVTDLGSKVAAGGGYDYPNLDPVGVAAAVGEKWLYATGEVVVMRGPPIIRQVMAHTDNDVFVLAERAYIAAVDCYASAVRVTVTA